MNPLTLKIIFTIGIVFWLIIRIPYQREQQRNTILDDRKTAQEKVIRFLVLVGILFVPLIYVLSPWLNFANYRLPIWANGLGIVNFAIALWLFWRTHHDLGRNWSPTLQIREGHTLMTNGVYHRIRHPMYTSVLSAVHRTSVIASELNCRTGWTHLFQHCLCDTNRQRRTDVARSIR